MPVNEVPRHTIAGGRIVRLSDLFAGILDTLSRFGIAESQIPDQCPLFRTLQFVAAYSEQLVPVLAKAPGKGIGGSAVA